MELLALQDHLLVVPVYLPMFQSEKDHSLKIHFQLIANPLHILPPILSLSFINTILMVHTCCVNELGCSYSGSGVSDVQANESFKTKVESVINHKVLNQVCVTRVLSNKKYSY